MFLMCLGLSINGLLALLSAALSWISLWLLIPYLRRSYLDQPNARSSHNQPTPRGGGIAFVLVGGVGVYLLGSLISLLCVPLALIGLLDDRQPLPAFLRYGIQLLTAVFLIAIAPLHISWLVWPLLLIGATALINFTNFMDGLDGLVAGSMAVFFAVAASQGLAYLWPLVGALLGFLVWNWSPAKVFMGDVGSTFLGAVFAGVLLQQSSIHSAFGLLLVGTPLLADSCICVLRRLLAGQSVFQAHRLHLYQRLHQCGWSHVRVASLYLSATVSLATGLLLGGWLCVFGMAVGVVLIGVWLDQRVAVPFEASSVRA